MRWGMHEGSATNWFGVQTPYAWQGPVRGASVFPWSTGKIPTAPTSSVGGSGASAGGRPGEVEGVTEGDGRRGDQDREVGGRSGPEDGVWWLPPL